MNSRALVSVPACNILPARCHIRQHRTRLQRSAPMHIRAEAGEQSATAPADSAEAGPPRCKLCGVDLKNAPRGCDNEGHVIKGLASWPGFGWFEALRVYAHCPEAAKAGIPYTRMGQGLDEVLFGNKGK